MSIFDISPPVNVNKGLAEPWRDTLPMQMDLMKTAAFLGVQSARMKQQRELANTKLAHDWWDKFQTDRSGMDVDQLSDISNMTSKYLEGNAVDINLGDMPVDKASVMRQQQGIHERINYYKALNAEKLQLGEMIKSPEGDFLNADQMIPLLHKFAKDEDGNMRTDLKAGAMIEYAYNAPEAIDVWDRNKLFNKHATTYGTAKEEWLDNLTLGEEELDVEYSLEGPEIWDKSALKRGQRILKPDVIASISQISPDYHKKVLRDIANGDARTYEQIVQDDAMANATGAIQIESWKVQDKPEPPKVGPGSVQYIAKTKVLDSLYNATVSNDWNTVENVLNLTAKPIRGISYERVTNKKIEQVDPVTGKTEEITVTGFLPRYNASTTETADPFGAYLSRRQEGKAFDAGGKQTKRKGFYLTEFLIQMPTKGDSADVRAEMARDNAIKMARLANILSSEKERRGDEMLDAWRIEKEGQIDLFGEIPVTKEGFEWDFGQPEESNVPYPARVN
ncbi:hypothetical protein LCGC14_0337290 [marine sediment metagenome]|uniref:Uncharacterized protein n=1 Tax=marine sediment metagenome TaxID=412755 RepID=A0A0F9TXL9_9ZZZZ